MRCTFIGPQEHKNDATTVTAAVPSGGKQQKLQQQRRPTTTRFINRENWGTPADNTKEGAQNISMFVVYKCRVLSERRAVESVVSDVATVLLSTFL